MKPANAIYMSQPGGKYQFQLGDILGSANRAVSAETSCGSPMYMAPEIFNKGAKTSKADIWSLLITILWTLNVGELR